MLNSSSKKNKRSRSSLPKQLQRLKTTQSTLIVYVQSGNMRSYSIIKLNPTVLRQQYRILRMVSQPACEEKYYEAGPEIFYNFSIRLVQNMLTLYRKAGVALYSRGNIIFLIVIQIVKPLGYS